MITAVGGRKHRFHMREGAAPICHIRAFTRKTTITACRRWRRRAARWMCIMPRPLVEGAAGQCRAPLWCDCLSRRGGQGSMSPEQFERLQAEMEMHHQGARNAGRPMLLEGGLDWKPMGFSPSDMEFQKTKEAAAREIAIGLWVPPMLLGIPGDATYANYQEANRAFYRLTVLPLAAAGDGKRGALAVRLHARRGGVETRSGPGARAGGEREQQWRRVGEASFLTDAEKRPAGPAAPCRRAHERAQGRWAARGFYMTVSTGAGAD
jgi:hypothetical protein